MKFIFTADLHLKLYSDKRYLDTGIPLKLHEIFSTFRSMCDYARENNIKNIIISGDVNDLKNLIHVRAFVILRQILESYSDLNFYFLHGNHDSSSKTGKESAVNLLSNELTNTHPIVETTSTLIDGFLFVPYGQNMVDDIKDASSGNILIAHLGLSDAQLSSGISLRCSLNSGDLNKFSLTLLGHYHKPQQVSEKCYYVGSPIQLTKSESNEEKRFLVVDSETLEVTSIPTVGYRKYIDLIIKDEEEIKSVLKIASQEKKRGNFVYIHNQTNRILTVSTDEIPVFNEFEEETQLRGITTAMSVKDQMLKYMEIEKIPENQRETYLTIGLEILEKAGGVNA